MGKTLPIQGGSQTKIVDTHSINDQFKIDSVHNQSDKQPKQKMQELKKYKRVSEKQHEQEHTLPTQGESPARTVDTQPVNDSVHNQSDKQPKQQMQEAKKYKRVSEQKREQ